MKNFSYVNTCSISGKQYKLPGETWSETKIIYAENPFETVVTAEIYIKLKIKLIRFS